MTTSTALEPAYRVFDTVVREVVPLSPGFLRLTVTGADLDAFADHGDDQRFKLVLPVPGHGFDHFPRSADWYVDWRQLPDDRRCPVRTYTVAAVRPGPREVDFVVARHGATGPASTWAESAGPGDPVLLVGPNARCEGPTRAAEWAPPARATVLLAGDETAVPAVLAIVAGLAADRRGAVVLEVSSAADVLPVTAPAGVDVRWLARDGRPHGSLLDAAVRAAAVELVGAVPAAAVDLPEDDDDDLLWDVASDADGFYAWLAGEAGVIRGLRRHLVRDIGVDKRSVTFMGYWKLGAAEAN